MTEKDDVVYSFGIHGKPGKIRIPVFKTLELFTETPLNELKEKPWKKAHGHLNILVIRLFIGAARQEIRLSKSQKKRGCAFEDRFIKKLSDINL